MSWSLNIGTIAGTAVRVHVTFLLFLGWIFVASYVAEGPQAALSGLVFMVLLLVPFCTHLALCGGSLTDHLDRPLLMGLLAVIREPAIFC